MSPSQLKTSDIKSLLIALKNKGRSIHAQRKADAIWREIETRLGKAALRPLSTAWNHLKLGEGDSEFNEECDKLMDLYCK